MKTSANRIALAFAVLVLLALGALILIPSSKTKKDKATDQTDFALSSEPRPFSKELQLAYSDLHRIDPQWFFTDIPQGHFVEKAADLAWKRGEELRALLARYSATSPETEALWKNFQNFGATVQISRTETAARPDERSAEGLCKGKELGFIPRSLAVAYLQRNEPNPMLAWRPDLGISLAAFEWPERFLAGALYHELHHGKKHPVTRPMQPQLDPASLAYAMEETEAHRIESMVLNAATNGAYYKRFDEIIARTSGKPEDCVRAITLDDLMHFDGILDMKNACDFAASYAFGQHFLGLGVYQMEKQKKSKEEWGRFFLWMRQNM